jgi:hypothetical protein
VSYGQTSDWLSHKAKYDYWKQHGKNKGLILYGVSRGTAATFCAYAQYQYPETKLVILDSNSQFGARKLNTRIKPTLID